VQSVPITTKVVSSNPVHGEVYSIQHYAIKFVSDLHQLSNFSAISWHGENKLIFNEMERKKKRKKDSVNSRKRDVSL
jgi:hypothetical protein